MSPAELETYLHDHIPLSRAMGVRVMAIGENGVTLAAPLAPNINHRETVFGGSASAVAILSAWSLLHLRLTAEGLPSRVVIQRNSMEYLAPTGDFIATSSFAPDADWAAFARMLSRRGRSRIAVEAVLEQEGIVAGRLHGEFVAFTTG
ncbi:thioesterase [Devosia geojensis]|uniref:Thioesterase n=1 Tax=Devosia geojensis TaxID=443610 RepID=A0A0F5FT32_9HYPH|nr:YiiD C-terminal domain-containing protein [Devosia geojensis]KKB12003.1 thioesterase [Devosia geojensis]